MPASHVRYVSYVYGERPAPGQRALHLHPSELERLGAAHDEFARYVVEVCPDCGWNLLTRRELHGRRHGARPPRGGGAVGAGTVGAAGIEAVAGSRAGERTIDAASTEPTAEVEVES